jgi:hypothetical protein
LKNSLTVLINIHLPHDPPVPLVGISWKHWKSVQIERLIWVLASALFIIVRHWKQPKADHRESR